MKLVYVKFKEDGREYKFISDVDVVVKDRVVVETERGIQLGLASKVVPITKEEEDLKKVIRIATDEDYDKYLNNIKEAKKTLDTTKRIVEKEKMNMSLVDATYSLDKRVIVFNFTSDERVDFRDLVKRLANKYRARIELHQLGVRDKSKKIGGIGPCGREFCCKRHYNTCNTVNINMAKNQDIALNPSKINGPCGRLLCCFNYENEMYLENRKKLPKIGSKVKVNDKECTVVKLNILKLSYTVRDKDNNFEEVKLND